jgi:hypothetical protein
LDYNVKESLCNSLNICIQNKEQGHDDSNKIMEFFFVINKKFSRVFLIFLDTKLSTFHLQSSIIKFLTHPIIQNFLLSLHHNFSIIKFTCLNNSISHIYMDAIQRIILQIITEVHYTIQRFTNKDH